MLCQGIPRVYQGRNIAGVQQECTKSSAGVCKWCVIDCRSRSVPGVYQAIPRVYQAYSRSVKGARDCKSRSVSGVCQVIPRVYQGIPRI